ncbi:hypothetical protein [Paraburkholderia fungorum]|uniref:hypothetical protein n=1 Tax=Paraburkholderia fungorum TaxID=134537 RepID=UPI0011C38097|nr:hypothetical protein [Paraburkholderia fungorum]
MNTESQTAKKTWGLRICAYLGLVIIGGTVQSFGVTGKAMKAVLMMVMVASFFNRRELEKRCWFRMGLWGSATIGGLLVVAAALYRIVVLPTH